jgi:hypothetical protein
VFCQNAVVIPAASQQYVYAIIQLRNVYDSAEDKLIEATVLKPGLVLGSSLVQSYDTRIQVRACNMRSDDVAIDEDTPLSTAHSKTVLEHGAPGIENHRSGKVAKQIQELSMELPDELNQENRKIFETLLHKYEKVLSVSECDMGYTDILTNKRNTGSNKTVQEALRRNPQAYLNFIESEVEKILRS